MIEGTCVDMHALYPFAPCKAHRMGQQPAAMPLTGQFGNQADESQLALTRLAEVELQHADHGFNRGDLVEMDLGMTNDGFKLCVAERKARKP